MANEISVNVSISCTNGEFILPTYGGSFNVDQTVAGGGVPGMVEVVATGETFDTSELTNEGICFYKNIGSVQAQIGISIAYGFTQFALCEPGESGSFRMIPGVVYQARTTTGTTRLQVIVLED